MSKTLKLVYVAGPYTAPTVHERVCNIHRAWVVGSKVANLGAMPVIPHKNTELLDDIHDVPFWIEGTLELMRRCDAVMLVEGWEDSKGTCGEVREAHARGLPIFVLMFQLRKWLEEGRLPHPEFTRQLLEHAKH